LKLTQICEKKRVGKKVKEKHTCAIVVPSQRDVMGEGPKGESFRDVWSGVGRSVLKGEGIAIFKIFG